MSVTDFTAYIAVHESLWDNPKTFALAQILSCERTTVVGMLVRLWQWSRRRGTPDISLNAAALAELMLWKSNADLLLKALVSARWLDSDANGSLSIHDWHDYLGVSLEKAETRRAQNREAQRKYLNKRLLSAQSSINEKLLSNQNENMTTTERLQQALPSALNKRLISAQEKRIQTKRREENITPGPTQKNIENNLNLSKTFQDFEQLTARTCSPAEYLKLEDLAKEHGEDNLGLAFAEARDNNARSIRYIETVLESWRAVGYDKSKIKLGGKKDGRSTGRNKQVQGGVRQLPKRGNYTTPEEFRATGGGSHS